MLFYPKLGQTCMALILSGVLAKNYGKLPKEIKESQSLDIFKRNIKAIPLDCSCKLCKSYIANLGFL